MAHSFDADIYVARRHKLIRILVSRYGCDAALITDNTDIRYLCGCAEGAAGLLITRETAKLFVGRMFAHVVSRQAPGIAVETPDGGLYESVRSSLPGKKNNICFQGSTLSVTRYRQLGRVMGLKHLIDMGDTVLEQRAVKDEVELRIIRKCARIAEQAFLSILKQGAAWLTERTEKEIAAELDYRMRLLGADRPAFPTIVASGPDSASCHHEPTDRCCRTGDPILIDWGAELDGYRSDITRVVFPGRPSLRMRNLYATVLEANRRGTAAVRPGISCGRVARTGWDVIRAAGYGEMIIHGLGHGLGLQVHEHPRIGMGLKKRTGIDAVRLRKNMVVTIEPGIYRDGVGGIRIEDDIRVTSGGCERITRLPHEIDAFII